MTTHVAVYTISSLVEQTTPAILEIVDAAASVSGTNFVDKALVVPLMHKVTDIPFSRSWRHVFSCFSFFFGCFVSVLPLRNLGVCRCPGFLLFSQSPAGNSAFWIHQDLDAQELGGRITWQNPGDVSKAV